MDAAVSHGQKTVITSTTEWEDSYRPLPFLFFGLLMIWTILVGAWTLNTWSKRRWQTSNLQWILTAVPVLKALVLGLSFVFWYSCLNLSTCSFWVAFGVFVSRIFFETACFIAFLLISHGYCIMHEQLSLAERRSIAGLASLLYLTLTGYKAAVPQFAILVVLIYLIMLYVIFIHVSRNLNVLRDQLQHIQDEGVHMMHTAIYTKYTMFKKFQGAMLMMVVAEILMHARADGVANEYWMRLLVREWTEIGIFFYIGWTFRSRELTPFFTVIPTLHSSGQRVLPPIYSVEMNQKDFNNLDFKEWHIGVPTTLGSCKGGGNSKPTLVIVQNPGMSSFNVEEVSKMKPTGSVGMSTEHPMTQSCHPSLPISSQPNPGLDATPADLDNCMPMVASQWREAQQRSPRFVSPHKNGIADSCCDIETQVSQKVSFDRASCDGGSRGKVEREEEQNVLYLKEVVLDVKGYRDYSLLPSRQHPEKQSAPKGKSSGLRPLLAPNHHSLV